MRDIRNMMHNLWLVWRIWKWPSVKRLPEYWALWMLLLVRAPYLCQWRAWLLCIHQRRLRNYRLTTIWALRSSEVGCNPPCVFLLFRIEIGNNMQMEVKFAIRRIWIHLLVISSMCTSCSISFGPRSHVKSYLLLYGSLALQWNSSTTRQIRLSTMLLTARYG